MEIPQYVLQLRILHQENLGTFFFRQKFWAELEGFSAASPTATVQVKAEKV